MENNYELEIWKPVAGYEGIYEVSNLGRIQSLKFIKHGYKNILTPSKVRGGHAKVIFYKDTIGSGFDVSRLVAIHFIPNPDNLPCACHRIETLDENGMLYNGADNLFWGTHSDNMKDKFHKGRDNNHFKVNHPKPNLGKLGKECKSSKPVYQYNLVGEFMKEWDSTYDAMRDMGIHQQNISKCCTGKRKTAGGYIWKHKVN